MKKDKNKKTVSVAVGIFAKTVSICIIGIIIFFVIYGIKKDIFKSPQVFSAFLNTLGWKAPVIFIGIQLIQVVIPVLPGAAGYVAGAIAFGPMLGFLYNYIAIVIGSFSAFFIARKYGIDLVEKLVNEKTLEKYVTWLDKGKKFDTFFAISILAPIAPDDLLCFIAGMTHISFKKFAIIILIGKPLSLIIYSLGAFGISSLI